MLTKSLDSAMIINHGPLGGFVVFFFGCLYVWSKKYQFVFEYDEAN